MPQGNVGSEPGVTSEAPVPSRQKQAGQLALIALISHHTHSAERYAQMLCPAESFSSRRPAVGPASHQAEVADVRRVTEGLAVILDSETLGFELGKA